MRKTKPRGLLEGSRKQVLLKKVNEIKWNRSFCNNSMSDITAFYEKRIKTLRNCNATLRENNEDLAKSLAEQKAIAQAGNNECASLKSQLLEYHERLVTYQLSDVGKSEEALMAEAERMVAAIVDPMKAAIKSGINNAIALADDLSDAKLLIESLPKRAKTMGDNQKSLTEPTEMPNNFINNISTGLPPLINRSSTLFSDASQQKMQKISEILRAERIKIKETQYHDMSAIDEMSAIEEISSSSDEASLEDDDEQDEETPSVAVVHVKKSPDVIKTLRRSTRQAKMSNFQLHLDISSDSDEEPNSSCNIDSILTNGDEFEQLERSGSFVSKRSSVNSTTSTSSISDFEKHQRSGLFVSKRVRNTKSWNRISSRNCRPSGIDSLYLSNDSVLEDGKSLCTASLNSCDQGILITPSPLADKSLCLAELKSPPQTVNTSMEFTACLSSVSVENPPSPIVEEESQSKEREWFKRKMSGNFLEPKAAGKTPYDTTMMEASPRSFHFRLDESPSDQTGGRRTSFTTGDNSPHCEQEDLGDPPKDEVHKENCPQISVGRKTRRTSRLTSKKYSFRGFLAPKKHIDSPANPKSAVMQSSSFIEADLSSPVKIKIERPSSVCPMSRLSEVNDLQTNFKLSPTATPEIAPTGRRRRAAAPVSLKEPNLIRKCRQGDSIGTSIYTEFIPGVKGRKRSRKAKS